MAATPKIFEFIKLPQISKFTI
jgi:hypothetical protein